MSTTPRTDAKCVQGHSEDCITGQYCCDDYVPASFAGQLETELATMQARAEKAEAKLEDVAALLRRVSWHIPQSNLLYIQVIDFLKRHKLTGKILRAAKEASK
jgi:hypothetical protein